MQLKVYSSKEATLDVIQEAKKTAPVIGTHNGTFHCDEVTACILLKTLEKWKDSTIIRTRDNNLLQECDIVVDNGHTYDPEKNRYDHHQRDFQVTWSENHTKTKLSSAGLVFKHFGKEILENVFGVESKDSEYLHNELYELFFESIDAQDNGVKGCDCKEKSFTGGMPGYGGLIGSSNTSWIIPEKLEESKCFQTAYETAQTHLIRMIHIFTQSYLKAKKEFTEAITNRQEVHPSKLVVFIDKYYRFSRFLQRFFVPTSSEDVIPQIIVWKEQWGDGDQVGEDWVADILPKEWSSTCPAFRFPTREELVEWDDSGSCVCDLLTLTKSRVICSSRQCIFAILEKTIERKV